jgi:hypothetical protein
MLSYQLNFLNVVALYISLDETKQNVDHKMGEMERILFLSPT